MEPRAYLSGATGTPPPYLDTSVTGHPQPETPTQAATVPGPRWFYMTGEEVRNVIIGGKLAPDPYNPNQMVVAIKNIIQEFGPAPVSAP